MSHVRESCWDRPRVSCRSAKSDVPLTVSDSSCRLSLQCRSRQQYHNISIRIISSEIRRRDAGLSLLKCLSAPCFKRSAVYGNYHMTTRCERLRVGSELWYERMFLVCSSSCSIARALRILILTFSINPIPSPGLYPVHTNTVFKLRDPSVVCHANTEVSSSYLLSRYC